MKKLFIVGLFVFTMCSAAFGKQIFTTTIQNTTVQEVKDFSVEYMMERNFAIDRVDDYTLTFTKGFGDGFWFTRRNMIVKFNVLQKDENVKLMVTQFEDSPEEWNNGQRAIEHLIPLIRDIRYSIDGTPLEQIVNEATNQQPGAREKTVQSSGLTFVGLRIKTVESGSLSDQAGLKIGDTIVEINGKQADEISLKDIDKRLLVGRSVMITYERGGNKDIVTLKKQA